MPDNNCPYKVSALILTYNQVDYIKKAVDSVIAQEVNFPYEIIIGDDYSTDGTREILMDYQQQYPDLIKLNLQDNHDNEGIAGRRNNITNILSAQGQYIAFLDGDDFWISKDKLQKQSEFMDAHPGFSLCSTDALIIHEETNKSFDKSDRIPSMQQSCSYNYKDVVKEDMQIISSSTFFRRKDITPLPPRFRDVYLADLFLQLSVLQNGSGRYFKDLHVGKVWSSKSVCRQYLSGRMGIKVKRNDHALIAETFSHQKAKPYSYKALFYMSSALRYKKQKKYVEMIISVYKVYVNDRTLVARWIKLGIDQNEGSLKKGFLRLISKFFKK